MNPFVTRNLSYGVYVIGTKDGDRPVGCIANSAMQITSSPITVAISINHDNYTNQCIEKTGKFSISILSVNCDPKIIGKFGYFSSKDVNKYEEHPYKIIEDVPVIDECCGYMVFRVINKMETSTHTVFLGEMVEGDLRNDEIPMTYSYYHKVIKGVSPKNAPTYIAE